MIEREKMGDGAKAVLASWLTILVVAGIAIFFWLAWYNPMLLFVVMLGVFGFGMIVATWKGIFDRIDVDEEPDPNV